MDDCYQKILESRWLKWNPSYTYKQWETARKKDWAELLKKSRPLLTIRISPEISFFDALESKDVFNKRSIEAFRVSLVCVNFQNKDFNSVFTVQCYASAVLAMGLCQSVTVCLSVCVCHKSEFYQNG